MQPSIVVHRRSAMIAAATFLLFIYETARLANQHLQWVPVTDAPQWARAGFHASIACLAIAVCSICAFQVIRSMQIRITPSLTSAQARQVISARVLEKRMPELDQTRFTIRLALLGDWRTWCAGAGLFLVTALPYWVLLALFGRVVALGLPYLAVQAWRLFSWPTAGAFLLLWLAFVLVPKPTDVRPTAADKAALTVIAFVAGSESWSGLDRWKVCVIYSLWLQRRGIFPLLTAVTAVPSLRVLIAVYCRLVGAGKSRDEALSHVLAIRVARLVTALAFYTIVALIRERAHIW